MSQKFKFIIPTIICVALMSSQYASFALNEKANSQPSSNISATDPRITKLTADLEYATKAEAEEILKYANAKAARQDADARLGSLNTKIKNAQNAIAQAEKDEATAKAEYADAQAKYDASIKVSDDDNSKFILAVPV